MNDVRGAIGVLCGVLWRLAILLLPACWMAWDALLYKKHVAASANAAAWILFAYILTYPNSTLVSVLSRRIHYFGRLPILFLAASLCVFGLYLFVFEYHHGLVLAIACPIILNLSTHACRFEVASAKAREMDYCDSSHRRPDTAEPSDDTPITETSDAHSSACKETVAKPTIWASIWWILSFFKLLLFASIFGFVVPQFIVSIAVNSITTRPISIDDAHSFGPDMLFETNVTEVSVAVNVTEVSAGANITESRPHISIPVNPIPDFITVFGTPTRAVPTPAPVAKSTWAPAATSTTMPTPEPTPSRMSEPEPEPKPVPEPEPEPEPERWIMPDGAFPVFQLMINKHISQAKAVKAWFLDLETEAQYAVIATAGVLIWALLPVLAWFTLGSIVIAVACYVSSLVFPLLQDQGYDNDQSLILCMSVVLDIIMLATSILAELFECVQVFRRNATVNNSDPDQQPVRTAQPISSTDSQLICTLRPEEQHEVNVYVRMYIEGLMKQQEDKLLRDAQLHAMVTNAVLLAMQGPDEMPMHAAAWQSILQQMWCQLVQHTVVTCLREQRQEPCNSPLLMDAPSEVSSYGQGPSSPDDSLGASLGTRDAFLPDEHPGVLTLGGCLLLDAPGAPSGEGARGLDLDLDVDGDDDDAGADTTWGNAGNLLADLDYLGDNGRIMGEYLCRKFARLLNGDYPPPKKKKGDSEEDDQPEEHEQHTAPEQDAGDQPPKKNKKPTRRGKKNKNKGSKAQQQELSPVKDAQPEKHEQDAAPEQDAGDQPPKKKPRRGKKKKGSQAQQQQLSPVTDAQPEKPASPEQNDQPEQDGAHDSPSTGDDVDDSSNVPEHADPSIAIEDEGEDSSTNEQGGDNNDTPVPTPSVKMGLAASRFADDSDEQPSTNGSDDTDVSIYDGEVASSPTVDGKDGDNNDTPVPTPPQKGLASSRFADEQPSTRSNDDGDGVVEHAQGSSNDGDVPSNSIDGGQGGDNNDTPISTPPVNSGLSASRFANEQPSTSDHRAGSNATFNSHTGAHADGGSQHRNGTPAAPSATTREPGIGGSRHNTGPLEGNQAVGNGHRSPAPSSPSLGSLEKQPAPEAAPSSGGGRQKLCQNTSSQERLVETSKYWHECLLDPNIVGKSDGAINKWYRTQENRWRGYRARGQEAPPVRPYKFPEDPEAAYRNPQPEPTSSPEDFPRPNHRLPAAAVGNGTSTPSTANNTNKTGCNKSNKLNKGGHGKGGKGNKT